MKKWKPIQNAFPSIDYPEVTEADKNAILSDPAMRGKYRFIEVIRTEEPTLPVPPEAVRRKKGPEEPKNQEGELETT